MTTNSQLKEISLQNAISEFNQGLFPSFNACAKAHGVSRVTLQRRLRGAVDRHKAHEEQQLISAIQEKMISGWIVELDGCGHPLSYGIFKQLVAVLIELNETSPNKTNTPGKRWISRFLRRNPEVRSKFSFKTATTRESIMAFLDSPGLYDPRRHHEKASPASPDFTIPKNSEEFCQSVEKLDSIYGEDRARLVNKIMEWFEILIAKQAFNIVKGAYQKALLSDMQSERRTKIRVDPKVRPADMIWTEEAKEKSNENPNENALRELQNPPNAQNNKAEEEAKKTSEGLLRSNMENCMFQFQLE